MTITDRDAYRAASLAYDSASNGAPEGFTKLDQLTGTDDSTSFEYAGYQGASGEYLIAFAGTEGNQDYFQNTKLGWEQWRVNRADLLEEISTILANDPTARIHFTGHSLGGALAQYAAYDAIDLLAEELARPRSEVAAQLEVTTFNGLGGVDGLEAYLPDEGREYDPTLAAALEATHYVVEGDIVSRLGGGHLGGNTRQLADPIGPYDPLTGHALATVEALTAGAEDFGALATTFTPDYLALEGARESIAAFLWSFDLNGDGAVNDFTAKAALAGAVTGLLVGNPEAVAGLDGGGAGQLNLALETLLNGFADSANLDDLLPGVTRADLRDLASRDWESIILNRGEAESLLTAIGVDALAEQFGLEAQSLFEALPGFLRDLAAPVEQQLANVDEFKELYAIGARSLFDAVSAEIPSSILPADPVVVQEGQNGEFTLRLDRPAPDSGLVLAVRVADPAAVTLFGEALDFVEVEAGLYRIIVPSGVSEVALTAFANPDGDEQSEIALLEVGSVPFSELSSALKDEIYGRVRIEVIDGEPDPDTDSPTSDTLRGGVGRDKLVGLAGSDKIIGGAGGDLLDGGNADDRLFAESEVAFESAVAAGKEAAGSTAQGEHIAGALGDDLIIGADRSDLLSGGPGDDRIAGGGGPDYITADVDYRPNSLDWSWSYRVESGTYYIERSGGRAFPSGAGDDELHGGTGDDYIEGGAGTDRVYGDPGDDILWGEGGGDAVYGGPGDDVVITDDGAIALEIQGPDFGDGGAGDDKIYGGNDSDVLRGGEGNDQIFADEKTTYSGNDILYGEAGDDRLFGGNGSDTLDGGAGADKLYGSNSGPAELDGNDLLYGGEGADELDGGAYADTLAGGEDADRLYGDSFEGGALHGDDLMDGGSGDDTLVGGGGNDQLDGGEGADTLDGDASNLAGEFHGDDVLRGGAGADTLFGGGGADRLEGGAQADTLQGDSIGEGIIQGADYLVGGAGDDQLIGVGAGDQLFGGDGNDRLDGDAGGLSVEDNGDDHLDGGLGDDLLLGYGGSDTLIGGRGNDELFGEVSGLGAAYHRADVLYGGAGDDRMNGGGGGDRLIGGTGRDVLRGDSDDAPAGADSLNGGDGGNRLFGNGNDDQLDGGAGGDRLFGQDGDDRLNGGLDADGLSGGAGDDVLIGGSGNDLLDGNEGTDTLDGGDGDDILYGSAGGDVVDGGAGADTLYGEGGSLVRGGQGVDRYVYVAGSGLMTIQDTGANLLSFGSGIRLDDLRLGLGSLKIGFADSDDEIRIKGFDAENPLQAAGITRFQFDDGTVLTHEELVREVGIDGVDLGGTEIFRGTDGDNRLEGGTGDDRLLGLAGDDLLDGGAGADEMEGGTGDDTYRVDNSGDTVIEAADGGADAVQASIDYALPDHVERLTLTDGAIEGRGNALANRLTGNAAANRLYGLAGSDELDGGAGADRLVGGADDDRYIVDNAADVVDEQEAGGIDTVLSSVDRTLSGWVDNLELRDAAVEGVGNGLANELRGNDTANVLKGLGGDDRLSGGAGDDRLRGGAGADTYTLSRASGVDWISDPQGDNRLRAVDGITPDDLSVRFAIDNDYAFYRLRLVDEGGELTDTGVDLALDGDGWAPVGGVQFEDGTTASLEDLFFDTPGDGEYRNVFDWWDGLLSGNFDGFGDWWVGVFSEGRDGDFGQGDFGALAQGAGRRLNRAAFSTGDTQATNQLGDASRMDTDKLHERWQRLEERLAEHLAGTEAEDLGGELASLHDATDGTAAAASSRAAERLRQLARREPMNAA